MSAAIFSALIGTYKDSIVILLIVIVNALIGSIQEHKAEKTIDALSKHLPQTVIVVRNGEKKKISSSDLVPGDIIYLSEGDKVSADIRLISSNELFTNDSIITGESEPQLKVPKNSESVNLEIANLTGSLFAGSQIISGNAIGLAVATGMKTQMGAIAAATEGVTVQKSPLQKETDEIAKIVAKSFIFVVGALLLAHFLINKYFNISEGLLFAVQIAAAIVPEGLPATISVALAIGARRMAKRKTAIKKLSTVETLGEVTVIVTDKTGTLTKGEMTVKEIFTENRVFEVGGVGYSLAGEISENGKVIKNPKEVLKNLFLPSILANNAEIDTENHAKPEFLGDTTELAILVAAEKAGFHTYSMIKESKVIEEIPFSSEKKYMAKVIEEGSEEHVYFKGAPNVILKKCDRIFMNGKIKKLTEKDKHTILYQNDEFSKNALRVIAVAQKIRGKDTLDNNLIFTGLFGITDPPRPEIKETIRIAKNAGIRTILITGDHGLTAAAIAKKVGLSENPQVITGEEIDHLNEKQLAEQLKNDDIVFARVDPMHKLRVVKLLQKMKHIVAVTGDGVNDSPALKAADAGIAMGVSGTDVSREAADAVLMNDSYSSIVWAIKEGRIIYENVEKFTKFEFTTHVAALTTVIAGIFIGIMPLFAIQILLMDYGAESFSAFALGTDVEEDDVMQRKPRNRDISLVNKENILYVLRSGLGLSITGVVVFLLYMMNNGWNFGQTPTQELLFSATALTYATFAISQIFNSFSIRSKTKPIYKLFIGNPNLIYATLASLVFIIAVVYLPKVNSFAKMAPIPLYAWGYVIIASICYAIYLELLKLLSKEFKLDIIFQIINNILSGKLKSRQPKH